MEVEKQKGEMGEIIVVTILFVIDDHILMY